MSCGLVNFLSDSESDTSPVVRAGVSNSSNPSPFVYDRPGKKVISIIDDFDSERLSMDSSNEGASYRDSSFDVVFSDDHAKGDHMTASMPNSFHVTETSTSHTLLTPKMKAASLRMEERSHNLTLFFVSK